MNEQTVKTEKSLQIDLRHWMDTLRRKAWMIVAAAVSGAVLAFVITLFFITPQYKSSVLFYVNNTSLAAGDAAFSVSSNDLSASRNLVESYIVILNARQSLSEVAEYAGIDRSYEVLKNMISAEAVNGTELLEVVVTSEDPVEAERIASGIAFILPKRIAGIIEGASVQVVDTPVVPSRPSSPSYTGNTLIGFALGSVLFVVALSVRYLLDMTIRREEDIAECCSCPVLAAVPDLNEDVMGPEISSAAAEAYRLLRTQLQCSFADTRGGKVIGISGAVRGEGRSLTAINLAYTLSQLDKNVILIDCDLRSPSLAEKLKIRRKPGLSDFLTGQSSLFGLGQYCGIPDDAKAFHVMTAGKTPANPAELLSSEKMDEMLRELRKVYDYVILDLPPAGEASDPLALAKQMDGLLLVVGLNRCKRQDLAETVRRFRLVNGQILGLVLNSGIN